MSPLFLTFDAQEELFGGKVYVAYTLEATAQVGWPHLPMYGGSWSRQVEQQSHRAGISENLGWPRAQDHPLSHEKHPLRARPT